MHDRRYNDYATALEQTYGEKVYRIGVDGGFSCPNRNADGSGGCSYCDETGSVAVYHRVSEQNKGFCFDPHSTNPRRLPEDTEESLSKRKEHLLWQIDRAKMFLDRRYDTGGRSIYFQAFTSTYGRIEILKQLYDVALSTGSYREFIVSTRSDCLQLEKINLIASYKGQVDALWVELGLQSGNDTTLHTIARNETVNDFLEACTLAHRSGIHVCAHIILGLPGESFDEIDKTAEVLVKASVEAVKIHNLHIVAGSRLFEEFKAGLLTAPSMERHLAYTIHVLRRLPFSMIIERFTSDTPKHRLAAPRDFGDKHGFVRCLNLEMERLDVRQGDLL